MKKLTALFLFAFVAMAAGIEPAVPGYTPALRLDAKDAGIILRHGDGPNQCDINGAREPTLIEDGGKYYLFYDGGGPKGWLACLATSTDLKTWTKHGAVLDFGKPGEPDAGSALSPWFVKEGDTWHMYYVTAEGTAGPPGFVAAGPYNSGHASSRSLLGPWVKTKGYIPVKPKPSAAGYPQSMAYPGHIVKKPDGEFLMFFGSPGAIGIARTRDLLGDWKPDAAPLFDKHFDLENSSLYFEPENQTWFLFVNHIKATPPMFTDAIWVFWTKDLERWSSANRAIALDGVNCTWSKRCIGMATVTKVGNRLAMVYDAAGGESIDHLGRDIGLAWYDLPLVPPVGGVTKGSSYSAAVLRQTEPALYWGLNETSGFAQDLAVTLGGPNDGEYDKVKLGGPGLRLSDGFSKMEPQGVAPIFNRNGAVTYGSLRRTAGVSTDRYSVQGWFRSTVPFGANAVHNLFGRGNSMEEARDMVGVGGSWNMSPLGKLYFFEPVTGAVVAGTTMLRPDKWYHVVLVRDADKVCVFLNGQMEIDAQALGWPGGDGEQLAIGNRTDYATKQTTYGLTGLVAEVGVWNRPLKADEVSELYALAGPVPPPPAFALFADAATPQPCFLAQAGQARALIVVGRESAPFYRWVAGEIQRYLRDLTGAELPIVSSDAIPAGQPILVIGGPKANPLSASIEQKNIADFAGLKPEGFIVQTVDVEGRPAVVIGGNDETATMYAAYEFLERLGLAFQITGDILPQRRAELKLPVASVRMEPALKNRGLHMRHFVMPWMGLDDFRRMIDQMAKLKFNYLEFYWYVGGPWIEHSHQGEEGQIDATYTKDSGYLTWNLTAGSHTTKDVKIGRELFKQERVCAPEFAKVQNQKEAQQVARKWLKEAIAYAHQRKIKIWLGQGDCPTVLPNLGKHSPLANGDWGGGALHMPPGDSVGVEIWEAMIHSMIETYPEADGYWVWLAEAGVAGMNDPASQKVISQYEVNGKRPHTDSDLALVHYGKELIQRLKARHPQAKLGLAMLSRSFLFPTLDKLVSKDVPFASMETGACFYYKPRPVPMEQFGGLTQRETYLVPRLDEDVNELAMQFNVGLYEFDGVLTGSVQHKVSGIAPQVGKLRGLEQNARYIADGCWNPRLTTAEFYEAYLRRLFGADALADMLKAYQILQENERATAWQGFANFYNYNGPVFIDLKPLAANPFKQAAPRRAPSIGWGINRDGYADTIPRLEAALRLLKKARPKVLPGALPELDYVIFKTESYILHLKTLCAWLDCFVSHDRVVEAKNWQDKTEVRERLDQCRATFLKARDLTRKSAGLMAAKAKDGDEKYILFRYNFGLVTPIEQLCDAMVKWSVPKNIEPSSK